jgi:uncharacterized cupin superfamily protein
MLVVNVAACTPDVRLERGAFRCAMCGLTDQLGASMIQATVYEMEAGAKRGPYHYHQGVEEWMYVVSGTPILRDPAGERTLGPGELVAFESGPRGAHTLSGPGRVVVFSAGWTGWGEAFITVYLDSDKIAAAPGVMFRRRDALDAWFPNQPASTDRPVPQPGLLGAHDSPAVDLLTLEVNPVGSEAAHYRGDAARGYLGARLGARTWEAVLYELAPGESTAPYHYEWCREEWALMLSGAATLRHPDGETTLTGGDITCFPQGPSGAHQLLNTSESSARLIIFSTSTDRPMSAFYPDEGTVLVQVASDEGFLFRLEDQIEDYWDGEPGADV